MDDEIRQRYPVPVVVLSFVDETKIVEFAGRARQAWKDVENGRGNCKARCSYSSVS